MNIFKVFSIALLFVAIPALSSPSIKLRLLVVSIKPWGYIDQNGNQAGVGADFADVLNKELKQQNANIDIELSFRPLIRGIHEFKTGKIDLGVFTDDLAESGIKQTAQSAGTVLQSQYILVGLPNAHPIKNLSELQGKRIGLIKSSTPENRFTQHKNIFYTHIRDLNQGIRLLQSNRIDVLSGTERSIIFALDELGLSLDDIKLMKVISRENVNLYISNASKYKDKLPELQRAVQELRNSGQLDFLLLQKTH